MKMYVIVNAEALALMNGNRGKFAAQIGHAFTHCFWDAEERFTKASNRYQNSGTLDADGKLVGGAVKIALIAPDAAALEVLFEAYHPICGVSLVKDAAKTVFKEPIITCLGLGPIDKDQIGSDLEALKLLL
jgi:peptidyl-tRNA hydrolase